MTSRPPPAPTTIARDRAIDRLRRDAVGAARLQEVAALAHEPEAEPVDVPTTGCDVIHGLDITVGLGIERRAPGHRMRVVLAGLDGARSYFGVDLAGTRSVADDLDWTFGDGAEVHGSAQDLLLLVCGRRLPPGRLRGERAARFGAGRSV